jgi:hypothetical protein
MKNFEVTVTTQKIFVIEASSEEEANDIASDVSGWSSHSFLEIKSTELDESQIESAKRHCDEFYPVNYGDK